LPLTDRQRAREQRARANWTPPGPLPTGPGDDPTLSPGEGETLDAFAGHWRVFQLAGGHRYSTDDLLAAWYARVCQTDLGNEPRRLLDLGSGIGSVALLLAWAFPTLQVMGLEVQPTSLGLARRSARYNGVADRVTFELGDLREPPDLGTFDLVTGSPPYWDPAAGTVATGPQKGPCRFEFHGGVASYARAAARFLAPGGLAAFVFDGRQRLRFEAAIAAVDLALVRTRDVISREGDGPLLLLAACRRPGEAPGLVEREEPLLLRHRDGSRSEEFRRLRAMMGFPPGPC